MICLSWEVDGCKKYIKFKRETSVSVHSASHFMVFCITCICEALLIAAGHRVSLHLQGLMQSGQQRKRYDLLPLNLNASGSSSSLYFYHTPTGRQLILDYLSAFLCILEKRRGNCYHRDGGVHIRYSLFRTFFFLLICTYSFLFKVCLQLLASASNVFLIPLFYSISSTILC